MLRKPISPHSKTASYCEEHFKEKIVLNKCEAIRVQNKYKWTANVRFVSYDSERRDRAYRDWVKLFLRSYDRDAN